jgi:hypothetical protein
MRRLAALLLLVALASMILSLASESAEARAKRKKPRRAASHATAVTSEPNSSAEPTPPDVVIPRRLLVLGFGGVGAQAVRTATLAALRKKPSLTLVPLRPSEALKIGTNYSPQKTVGLAKRLNLTAVLFGEVTRERGKVMATFTLANGEDARIVGEIAFEARTIGALRAKIRTQLWPKLSPLIDQSASPGRAETPEAPAEATPPEGKPPAGETPPGAETPEEPETKAPPPRTGPPGGRRPPVPPKREPEVTPPVEGQPEGPPEGEPTEEKPEKPPGGPVEIVPEKRPHKPGPTAGETPPGGEGEARAPATPCSVADLEPGGGVMFRRFNYRDEQRGALRGFMLLRAPVGRIEGTIYPFGGGLCRRLPSLGVRLAYEQQGPAKATLAGASLSTSASAYQAEVVLRIVHGRFSWQPAVGYYVRRYSVDTGVIPTADYRSIGARLDGNWRLRLFTFELGVGGRRPLSVGTLGNSDWFPGLSALTVTGRAQIGLAVTDWIDILLGGYAEYDYFKFNIASGQPYPNGVASGAFDLYLQGLLSMRFRFGLGHPPPR